MSDPSDPLSPDHRAQETASEYPGPRKASTGETVVRDPARLSQPAGADAREGRPAAGGRRSGEGQGRTASTPGALPPPGSMHDSRSAADGVQRLPPRDDDGGTEGVTPNG
jgi:hypothetical protein